jgi:NADPH-dependent 2,4-dienoyl-CoA reductase/sulfur reductase-like enzyme
MRVVIAGAGLAAQWCCEALRGGGHDGPMVMGGEEPHAPYDRPPLSKAVAAGEHVDLGLRPASWYADRGDELRLGVAARPPPPAALASRTGSPGLAVAARAGPCHAAREFDCSRRHLSGLTIDVPLDGLRPLRRARRPCRATHHTPAPRGFVQGSR